jgi:aryl-alcohol dehydrogenase-like predicted oxidoreductase
MMEAFATTAGTGNYSERFVGKIPPDHFRAAFSLQLSSIGMGTYLGNPDPDTDGRYREAVKTALGLGCNVIDTAINYRFQRSEKSIGQALQDLRGKGHFSREEIFVSSKAGFIPYEDSTPSDPNEFVRRTLVNTGIVQLEDIIAGCHCMAPRYLEQQLQQSLNNLQLECIDLYFLHNPETQLQEIVRDEFNHRIRDAFTVLENAVRMGRIRYYGAATWNGFTNPPHARDYLSLRELLQLAEEVAGQEHHFRAIQLPLNLAMPEAFTRNNQEWNGGLTSVLQAAKQAGLLVMASASIYQGNLTRGLPSELKNVLGQRTDAQNAIQYTRSTPGITTALVGMKNVDHVLENMQTATSSPLDLERYMQLYKSA